MGKKKRKHKKNRINKKLKRKQRSKVKALKHDQAKQRQDSIDRALSYIPLFKQKIRVEVIISSIDDILKKLTDEQLQISQVNEPVKFFGFNEKKEVYHRMKEGYRYRLKDMENNLKNIEYHINKNTYSEKMWDVINPVLEEYKKESVSEEANKLIQKAYYKLKA